MDRVDPSLQAAPDHVYEIRLPPGVLVRVDDEAGGLVDDGDVVVRVEDAEVFVHGGRQYRGRA